MGKRTGGLINCINPAHSDSSPSMAVYQTGGDKLQVFCFGCKYHAYVLPSEVVITPVGKRGVGAKPYKELAATTTFLIGNCVMDFFTDRNITPPPWASLRYGMQYEESSTTYYSQGVPFKRMLERPAMEWDLLDQQGNKQGVQRRYLDDKKPKTKYFPNTQGEYAKEAWINRCDTPCRALNICESWVDAQWVFQRDSNGDAMSILGTSTKHINTRLYELSKQYKSCSLFFDGDKAGIKATNEIRCALNNIDMLCYIYTTKDKKVYELND